MSNEERESRRVGPFYRPKKLTQEEINARRIDKAKKMEALQTMIKEGGHDKYTSTIATLLNMTAGFGTAKLYLWRALLFNALIVEIAGFTMFAISNNLLGSMMFAVLATVIAFMVSFCLKFIIYSVWLFKKKEKVKQ